MAAAEADAVILGQCLHKRGYLPVAVHHGLPVDTLQGIIQKMGLYLGLQGIETNLLNLMLFHFHLLHEHQDLLHHGVETDCQFCEILSHVFHVDAGFQGT